MPFAGEPNDTSFLPPGIASRNANARRKLNKRRHDESARLRRLVIHFPADNSTRHLGQDPYEGSAEVAAAQYGLVPQPVLVPADPEDEGNVAMARNAASHLALFETAMTPLSDGGYSQAALDAIRDVSPMPPGVKIEYALSRPTGEDSPLASLL